MMDSLVGTKKMSIMVFFSVLLCLSRHSTGASIIKDVVDNVTGTTVETKDAVDNVTGTTEETKDAVDNVTGTTEETKDAVNNVIGTTVETKDAVDNVTRTSVETKNAVDNVTGTSVETKDAVDNVTGTTVETKDAVDNVTGTTVETKDAVNNVTGTTVGTKDAVDKASTGDNVTVILTDHGSDKIEDFKRTTTEIATTDEYITVLSTYQTNFQNKRKTEINLEKGPHYKVVFASGQLNESHPLDVTFPLKNTKSDTKMSEEETAIIPDGSLDVSTPLFPNELSQKESSNLATEKPETRDEESTSGFATNKDTEDNNQDNSTVHSERNSRARLLGRRVPDEEGIKSVIDPSHETFFEIKGNRRQGTRTGRNRIAENEFITDDTSRLIESPLNTDDICPKDCPITEGQVAVCGTNGKVYDSLCFLQKENCGSDVKVGSWEFCRGQHHLCPSTCLDIYEPVCSEDSIIYRNPCIMQRQNCGKEVKTQDLKNCYIQHREFRSYDPCPQQCLEVYDPTCGSDGRVYFNECYLRKKTCGEGIRVVDMKQCVQVRDCPRICVPFPEVVCGSDGKLYLNECRLLQKNCGKDVRVRPDSFCGKQS
ncbi:uncharacterized protein LOC111088118 [Limulus polyphemus]|uniref:Uncharacterized protein LOC111088118 n=1 Tax=Limulus polyphemus TaxID=6850 RepID=A0ABM1TAC8_LIMPO|nr:uncharacterized protein LOC111088118 [Limulus polyphemus]